MSAVESDSHPKLAGNETGERWGTVCECVCVRGVGVGGGALTRPLAFVNCVSHVVLAGTVNWKRSRGFAVLMSFP